MNKLMFIDVETTGLDKTKNAIHQLSGCVVIDNVVVECFDFKIRPFEGATIEQEALDVCNLTKEQLFGEDYLPENEVYLAFSSLCCKYVQKFNKKDKFFFVGYNAHFDKDFMYEFFMRNNDKYFFSLFWGNHIDVMVLLSYKLMDKRIFMDNFKQGTVAKYLGFDIKEESLHNSLYDIFVCLGLYCYVTEIKIEQSKLIEITKNEQALLSNYSGEKITDEKLLEKEFETVLKFGKYKTKTIAEVLETDASYLCWVYENMKNQYTVSDAMYKYCLKLRKEQEELSNNNNKAYNTPSNNDKVIDHLIDSMTEDDFPF